jgi:single-stranded-DNA-specific exonuclease
MTDVEFCNETSVLGRKWAIKDRIEGPKIDGIDPIVVSVAASRGFDATRFFAPTLHEEMPDPSIMKGMDEAVKAFCDAVIAGRKIAVYGDYDVDGATSTSMMIRWLRLMGNNAIFYIPDRLKEGYGPNEGAIRRLHAEEGIEFLLFLDCGTVAHKQLAVARDLGMEVVVIDHHDQNDQDPPAILVNPKRRDETGDYAYLCTAGLVFVFLVAVQREMRLRSFFNDERPAVSLQNWLGIVALGTVCDIVPLRGLNRAYVHLGLPKMGEIPGIKALTIANGDPEYNERTCGFVFGPCINAEGRIGDTRSGTMLLSTDDMDEAHDIAQKLVETNKERQEMTKAAQTAAVEIAVTTMQAYNTVVIYNEDWHPGIVGIVASKVKDAVNKPTVIIGSGGTGSCRSVTGYDIGADIRAAMSAGMLHKGGGHAMAAGLHVDPERVPELLEFLSARSAGFVHPPKEIDLAIPCGRVSPELIDAMMQLRPFGTDNPQPRVVIHGGYVSKVTVMKELHVKVMIAGRYGSNEAVIWNAIGTPLGDALRQSDDKFVDVYGTARVDTYGGKRKPVLIIEDAMIKENEDEMVVAA